VLLVVALLGVRRRPAGSRPSSLDDAPDAPRAGPGPATAGEPARDE